MFCEGGWVARGFITGCALQVFVQHNDGGQKAAQEHDIEVHTSTPKQNYRETRKCVLYGCDEQESYHTHRVVLVMD